MPAYFFYCAIGLLAGLVWADTANALEDAPLAWLEQRLVEVDSELEQLASYSLRSGTGAVGYKSAFHRHPENKEWVRIDLGDTYPLDQIILVPTIWRDSKSGLQAAGFPTAFRILAGTANNTHVVKTFTQEDNLLPRIAPLIVTFPPMQASWVRVEATTLSSRGWDTKYALQLSEIMVFSGEQNVALQKAVSTKSSYTKDEARYPRFLVDGFLPYLMDAAQGAQSKHSIFIVKTNKRPAQLKIDLGKPTLVNQVNLHAVNVDHTFPEAAPSNHAVPRHLRVIGANQPDFKDSTILFEYKQESVYDTGPIIVRAFPETLCRYIKFIMIDNQPNPTFLQNQTRIGFSEIEIISQNENVALGKPFIAGPNLRYLNTTLPLLTDGNNFYGKILPIRDWMNQLARRHDLETERPKIEAELNQRYAQQKTTLNRMYWLAVLLATGTVFTILFEKNRRQRAIYKTRERIAADLHDELGANLHAIGIFANLAKNEANSSERQKEIINRISTLTDLAGASARHCSNMLEAKELYQDLVEQMKRTSSRLLADTQYDLSFQGEECLHQLNSHKRVDLFLFYKESLTNIVRHAKATQVSIKLTATLKQIQLIVEDNGLGISEEVPPSLMRRAKILGARVNSLRGESGGTQIILILKLSRIGVLK